MTHPERLARVAAMAREMPRFHVPINDPTGTESAQAIYWRVMQPIVAAATSCRLFDLPRKERQHMVAKDASPSTRRYVMRTGGRIEVEWGGSSPR